MKNVSVNFKNHCSGMKRIYDILLNVLLPLILGSSFYFLPVWQLLRNHFADGLWAYALTSLILIIWNRQINLFWMGVIIICFPFFEYLQHIGIVKGTADLIDVVFYVIFFIIALVLNKYITLKIYNDEN